MAASEMNPGARARRPKVRTNGEGSVFQVTVTRRNGDRAKVWRATRTAYLTDDGKQVKVSGEGATQQAAIERREANWTKLQVRRGQLPLEAMNRAPSDLRLTVSDWLWRWHAQLSPDDVGEQTRAQYASRIRLHLDPHIGKVPVRLLDEQRVEELIYTTLPNKKKITAGRETAEPLLRPTAIRNVFFVLSAALDYAVKKKIVERNVCRSIKTPKRSKRTDEGIHRLTWAPQHLLSKLEGTEDEARWILAFYGLRQSEALGLTDDCLRLNTKARATLTIKQQLARHKSEHGCGRPEGNAFPCGQRYSHNCPKMKGSTGLFIKQDPKTEAGRRVIPVMEPLFSVLTEHMKRQKTLRESPSFAPLAGMETLVFTTPSGKPRKHQVDNRQWRALLEKYEVPHMRGHVARHITVSLLISQGVPADVVKKIVGHSDLTMTEHYTHLGTQEARQPLAGLGQYLGARTKRTAADVANEREKLLRQQQELAARLAALEEEA